MGLFSVLLSVLPLNVQLPRGEGWNPFNRLNTATCACMRKQIIIFYISFLDVAEWSWVLEIRLSDW